MKNRLIYILLVLMILVSGCATPTPYQKVTLSTFSGGYYDDKLPNGDYQVRFTGNGYTSIEQTVDFAILRCSEITLDAGREYFEIIDGGGYTWSDSYSTGTYFGTSAKPEAKFTFRILDKMPTSTKDKVLNANETKQRIINKHQLNIN